MPGRQVERRRPCPTMCSSSSRISGRGPTRLISPRSTLISCGSSSSDQRAQEAAERRDPRVVRDLEHPRAVLGVLVQVRRPRLALLRVDVHRAELEDLEAPAAGAHPLLAEEHRARASSTLIRSAAVERAAGCSTSSARPATTCRSSALEQPRRARQSRGGPQPDQREAVEVVHVRCASRSPRTCAGRCRPGRRAPCSAGRARPARRPRAARRRRSRARPRRPRMTCSSRDVPPRNGGPSLRGCAARAGRRR